CMENPCRVQQAGVRAALPGQPAGTADPTPEEGTYAADSLHAPAFILLSQSVDRALRERDSVCEAQRQPRRSGRARGVQESLAARQVPGSPRFRAPAD